MKTNSVSRRQFQRSIAQMPDEKLRKHIFIHLLTDATFAKEFATKHNLIGVRPKFFKRKNK